MRSKYFYNGFGEFIFDIVEVENFKILSDYEKITFVKIKNDKLEKSNSISQITQDVYDEKFYRCKKFSDERNIRVVYSSINMVGGQHHSTNFSKFFRDENDKISANFQPSNPYDKNAIVIKYKEKILGYVDKYRAAEISNLPNQTRENLYIRPLSKNMENGFYEFIFDIVEVDDFEKLSQFEKETFIEITEEPKVVNGHIIPVLPKHLRKTTSAQTENISESETPAPSSDSKIDRFAKKIGCVLFLIALGICALPFLLILK